MDDSRRKIYRNFLSGLDAGSPEGGRSRSPMFVLGDETWAPPTDILETQTELIIIMEIAGIHPHEIDIQYSGGILTIEGSREELPVVKNAQITYFHKKEIDYGHFRVRVKITSRIVSDAIEALYESGFLMIHLPKDPGKRKSSSVKIPVK